MSGPRGTSLAGESPRAAVPGARMSRRPRGPRWPWGVRRWRRTAVLGLAVLGIVAAGAWALYGSRLLAVRSVVITGTHLVPKSEVLAVAGIRPGTPLIRVDTGQIAARVETIPQVRSAQVSRSWPDRVVITVRERTAALAVAAPAGGFDLVDPDGVVVRWAARRPPGLPLYLATSDVTSLRGDPDVSAAAAVLAELPAKLRRSVALVTAASPDQVTLRLTGGITVLWGGADHAWAKARELAVLMRTHARYYDISALGTAMTS
jgi:cell division protein FtsQ